MEEFYHRQAAGIGSACKSDKSSFGKSLAFYWILVIPMVNLLEYWNISVKHLIFKQFHHHFQSILWSSLDCESCNLQITRKTDCNTVLRKFLKVHAVKREANAVHGGSHILSKVAKLWGDFERCRSWDGHWRLTFCDSFPIQKPEKIAMQKPTRNGGVCDKNKFTWEGCGNTTGWLGIWILSIISNAESSTIEIIINCSFRQTNGFFNAARFAVKHLPKAPWKKTAEKQSALGELHGISAPTKEFLLILDICKALSHMWGSGHLRGLLKRVVCWDGLPGKYLHLWSSCVGILRNHLFVYMCICHP